MAFERPPSDAKEWACPECGGDVLWNAHAEGCDWTPDPPPEEPFDDLSRSQRTRLLRVIQELYDIAEEKAQHENYPNRDFDAGYLSAARALLEDMFDPDSKELREINRRWAIERLDRVVRNLRDAKGG